MILQPIQLGQPPKLSDAEAKRPDSLPGKAERQEQLQALKEQMTELQRRLFAQGRQALLVVLQARDAGGKDGTIRRVFGSINPQGCRVTGYGKPTERELKQDYLWRIHTAVPRRGMIGVFNRSHYEDVFVVRVKELVPEPVWRPRYEQINDFERMLSENDVTILKFFLHVSKDEQRRRLLRRLEDPKRNWKFNPEDLKARNEWEAYTVAYREALSRCSTDWAPWYVVPADSKSSRDMLVAQVVVDALERMDPEFPTADPDVLRYVSALNPTDR
jgi:PPK2 family polyphosphate:nucleotide phosphotransferase